MSANPVSSSIRADLVVTTRDSKITGSFALLVSHGDVSTPIHHKEAARTGMLDPPIYDPSSEDGWWELPRTRLSDRLYADLVDPKRRPLHQWRGVRTAPKGVGPSIVNSDH